VPQTIDLLPCLKGCDVSVKDKVIDLLYGALHMAASGGHTEIIKYLQSKGCDVSVPQTIDLLPCL
jgi:hypothetical protein